MVSLSFGTSFAVRFWWCWHDVSVQCERRGSNVTPSIFRLFWIERSMQMLTFWLTFLAQGVNKVAEDY